MIRSGVYDNGTYRGRVWGFFVNSMSITRLVKDIDREVVVVEDRLDTVCLKVCEWSPLLS